MTEPTGSPRDGSTRDGSGDERPRQTVGHRQLLDSMIEHAPVGICVTDADRCFVRVNPAYVNTYGWSREDLIGEPFTKMLPAEDRAWAGRVHDGFIRGRIGARTDERIHEASGEWHVQCSDGTRRDALVRARRVEHNGEPFTVATVLDVTTQKQTETALRRREQYLAVTLNSIGEAVIATDAEGRVTQMNDEAERLTGWRRGEASGRALPEVFQVRANA